MAKHLRIEGASLPQHNKVLVKVTAQTNVGRAFGSIFRGDFDSRKFTASNGVTLGSNKFPAKDKDDKNVFWVCGTGDASKQATTVVVSKTFFERLKVAVTEYNAYFAAPAAPAPACASAASCVTVIG